MQLPDMRAYRQISTTQHGEYTVALWEPIQIDRAERQRMTACLLEMFSKENQGKCVEKGRNIHKM